MNTNTGELETSTCHLEVAKQIRNRNKQTDKQMDNTNSRFASWLKTMIISQLPEPKPYLLSSWINWPWDSGNPRH